MIFYLLMRSSILIEQAVLGFVKVLVSCLEPSDLQHFLSGIVDGILRWSSVSRHHFKPKVCDLLCASILNDNVNNGIKYGSEWRGDVNMLLLYIRISE